MEAYLAILIGTVVAGGLLWLVGFLLFKVVQEIFDPLVEWAEKPLKKPKDGA